VAGGRVVANGRRASLVSPAAKEPMVLAAGRLWDEAKNVAALDRVAATIVAPVVIAGATEHPSGGSDWEAQGAQLLGSLPFEELAGWMSRAAVFALPARYEPFGLAALEAARAGCALVLGDIPSLREVWGDAATFAPPDDEERLAHELQALIADPDLRADYSGRARRRSGRYSAARMAEGYLAAYETVLQRGRVSAT
jgi:glycosyltransferase involved in cell wall biosynthesis